MSCGCGKARAGELCQECELPVFTRNNWFTGKFCAALDFIVEQQYFMGKGRRHDQYLHGWGTVCGLEVTPHPQAACRDRWVVVAPGVAVDCCGREIVVREPEYIDVREAFEAWWVKQGNDPAKIADGSAHTLQLVLRYVECPTEDVPVLFDDVGCDDTRCQPNRILESYAIDVTVDHPVHPLGAPPLPSAVLERLAIADADLLAMSGTGRLFVTRAGATPSIEAYDDLDLPAIASASLAKEATSLAVSTDGTRVFVGEDSAADATVHVLDGADPALAELTSVTLTGGGGGALRLVYDDLNDRAMAQSATDGKVRAFASDGSGLVTVTTLAGAVDLAVSGDGNRVYLVDGSASVTVADAHNPATLTTTLALGAGAKGQRIALLPAAYPGADDRLVVAADTAAGPTLMMLVRHPNGSSDKYAEPLTVAATALAVDPDGLYVAAAGDRTDGTAVVQVVTVAEFTSPTPATPIAIDVGTAATTVTIDGRGRVLAAATMTTPGGKAGGIAIIGAPVGVCRDLWQRALEDCPSCDEDDVLVLATIGAYHLGDVLDATRIDNLTDRRLLPSVSLLAEVVQCLLEQDAAGTGPPGPQGLQGLQGLQGIQGIQGIQGLQGLKGDPGAAGTDSDLPHVVAINWPHGGRIRMNGEVIDDQGAVLAQVDLNRDGLLIAFSEPMMPETLVVPQREWSAMSVLAQKPVSDEGPLLTQCWCELVGRVQALNTKADCEQGIVEPGNRVQTKATGVRFRPSGEWMPGRYRVVLKGDYVLAERTIEKTRNDGSTFKVHAVLDGNHLAPGILGPGGVGPRRLPARCPSGDWIEGGTFESWFEIVRD